MFEATHLATVKCRLRQKEIKSTSPLSRSARPTVNREGQEYLCQCGCWDRIPKLGLDKGGVANRNTDNSAGWLSGPAWVVRPLRPLRHLRSGPVKIEATAKTKGTTATSFKKTLRFLPRRAYVLLDLQGHIDVIRRLVSCGSSNPPAATIVRRERPKERTPPFVARLKIV